MARVYDIRALDDAMYNMRQAEDNIERAQYCLQKAGDTMGSQRHTIFQYVDHNLEIIVKKLRLTIDSAKYLARSSE
jgi:hypothetical protein